MQTTHQVISGDTLFSLAKKYGLTVNELKSINNLTSDTIKVGQVLKLTPFTHTVVSGDTLYSLAKKYATTVETIQLLNELENDLIKVGQVLRLPEIYDEELALIDENSKPLANCYYSIELCNGTTCTGRTNQEGVTQKIASDYCAKIINITVDETVDLSLPNSNMMLADSSKYTFDLSKQAISLSKAVSTSSKQKERLKVKSIPSPKIKLTSETVLTLPANRKRKAIGVGESVIITSNIDVDWQVSNNLIIIDSSDSRQLEITALDNAGIVTITAQNKNNTKQTANMVFSIVQPTDVSYSQQFYPNTKEPMLYHPKNGYEGGVGIKITLLPTTVNFGNLNFGEVDSAGVMSGVFDDGKIHCHSKRPADANGQCTFHTDVPVAEQLNKHNIAGTYDAVGGGEDDPKVISNLPAISSMKLEITLRWRLRSSNKWWHMPNKVKQSLTLFKNGNIKITKGNFSKIFQKTDDFPNNRFVTDDSITF